MLKWMFHRQLRAFERKHHYDASYMHDVLEIDTGAFVRFGFATGGLGSYRKDVPADAYYAAALVSSMDADCGPCTQLGVEIALSEGVAAATLAAVVAGDDAAMSADVALAARFARAVLAHDPDADACRDEITRRWGARAVLSLSYAIMAAQLYPTLKYALGHGKACSRVVVGEDVLTPVHARREAAAAE